jgi:hypothetical protein
LKFNFNFNAGSPGPCMAISNHRCPSANSGLAFPSRPFPLAPLPTPGYFHPVPATFAGILSNFFYKPVMRPVVRLVCGLIAIPLFRFVMRRVFRVQVHNDEMERDLEQWFRGAIVMLAATANLEHFLFGWSKWWQQQDAAKEIVWQTLALRLLLAVGVIESMPDEDIFSVVHRGPPKLKLTSRAGWKEAWADKMEVLKGIGVLHLRRSSPVFLIMAVILGGKPGDVLYTVGWWCYGLAITQYLIIALITQRDKFEGILDAFDRGTSAMRDAILIRCAGASTAVSEGDEGDPNLEESTYRVS